MFTLHSVQATWSVDSSRVKPVRSRLHERHLSTNGRPIRLDPYSLPQEVIAEMQVLCMIQAGINVYKKLVLTCSAMNVMDRD